MDLLLIKAPYRISDTSVASSSDYDVPPLGIYTLKAYLDQFDYQTMAIHLISNRDLVYVKELVIGKNPKIVGISATTYEFLQAVKIAKMIKKINPKIIIVIGGPHASINYREALSYEEIDIVSRFEGEETLKELLDHFDNGKISNRVGIRGIAYKEGGQVVLTPDREYLDLNRLPSINYHDIRLNRYKQPGVLITSRGCVGRCTFCAVAGGQYRERNAQKVYQDLHELYDGYGIKQVNILDNSFTINKRRVYEICNLILENSLPVRWNCETRIEGINRELLLLMKKAGCYAIQLGIESANDKTLKNIRKGIDVKSIDTAIRLSLEADIEHVCCNFIIGLPGDTEETLEETFRYMRRYKDVKQVRLSVSVLTPYPGSYIYDHAENLGVKILTKDWTRYNGMDVVCETDTLSEKKIRDLYYKAYNEFYMPSYQEYL